VTEREPASRGQAFSMAITCLGEHRSDSIAPSQPSGCQNVAAARASRLETAKFNFDPVAIPYVGSRNARPGLRSLLAEMSSAKTDVSPCFVRTT